MKPEAPGDGHPGVRSATVDGVTTNTDATEPPILTAVNAEVLDTFLGNVAGLLQGLPSDGFRLGMAYGPWSQLVRMANAHAGGGSTASLKAAMMAHLESCDERYHPEGYGG
jgi:hypothetical protein